MNKLIVAITVAVAAFVAIADDGHPATGDVRLDEVSRQLDTIDATVKSERPVDADLAAARDKLAGLQDVVDAVSAELTPRLAQASARLEELGAPPERGSENPELARQRQQLEAEHQQVDDELKRARLLDLRAHDTTKGVAKRRRDLFSAQLSSRSPSIIGVLYWRAVARGASVDGPRFASSLSDSVRQLGTALHGQTASRFAVTAILAVLLLAIVRSLAEEVGRRLVVKLLPPSRLRRTLVALWVILTTVAAPVIATSVIVDILESTGAVSPLLTTLLDGVVAAVRVAALMHGLMRGWLAPKRSSWRLLHWSEEEVARVRYLPLLLGVVVALRMLWERLNDQLGTSLSLAVLGRIVFTLAAVTVAAIGLWRVARIKGEGASESTSEDGARPEIGVPVALFGTLAWVALISATAAILAGFSAFGIFVVRELVQISVVGALLQLLVWVTDDIFGVLLSEHFLLGRFLRAAVGMSGRALSQITVVLSGVSRVALVYMAIRVLLLRLGGEDVSAVTDRIQEGLSDLRVGEVNISPSSTIGAILVFCAFWLFTRAVRRWLENSYLPQTALDSGARTSVSTGVGYLGFLIASLAAIAYLGVSLEKVALIASALSIGIGFGLQAIISNFVSGLILLVERPIKVGDQVSVSGSTGDVKRISVRATEISLGDGSIVVVPNSDLISKPVVNRTRTGARGLVQIMLRVVYGTDPDQVRKLVFETIVADERLLKDPPPKVYIDDVDDRGYVFNVQANVANPRDVYAVRSDLFFAVTRRLRDAGIALANPLASSFTGLSRRGADSQL